MRREVKVYDWTCDRCGVVTRHEGDDSPMGWQRSRWYCDSPACDGHERWSCGLCSSTNEQPAATPARSAEQGVMARARDGLSLAEWNERMKSADPVFREVRSALKATVALLDEVEPLNESSRDALRQAKMDLRELERGLR